MPVNLDSTRQQQAMFRPWEMRSRVYGIMISIDSSAVLDSAYQHLGLTWDRALVVCVPWLLHAGKRWQQLCSHWDFEFRLLVFDLERVQKWLDSYPLPKLTAGSRQLEIETYWVLARSEEWECFVNLMRKGLCLMVSFIPNDVVNKTSGMVSRPDPNSVRAEVGGWASRMTTFGFCFRFQAIGL